MLKDIFIGEDTSAYEDISDTDPETLAEPVDVLMIENTTDTEDPNVDTINTASVVPPEEALPETTAETELSAEEYTVDTAPVEVVEIFPVEEKIYDISEISCPLAVCGGTSKDTAYAIAPGLSFTNEGMPVYKEEWYKFETSSNSSAYIFSGINDGSMWPVYFTVYSDDIIRLLLPFRYPINCATLKLGVILTSICIWSGHASAACIVTPFCSHSCLRIFPTSALIFPYTTCLLYFGANTI